MLLGGERRWKDVVDDATTIGVRGNHERGWDWWCHVDDPLANEDSIITSSDVEAINF